MACGLWAQGRGFQVTRRGGPDLWLITAQGLVAVKVRTRRSRGLRRDRRRVLRELEKLGVPVMVWAADDQELRSAKP